MPDIQSFPFEDRLTFLVERETTLREDRRLTRLLREACLRLPATIEDLNSRAAQWWADLLGDQCERHPHLWDHDGWKGQLLGERKSGHPQRWHDREKAHPLTCERRPHLKGEELQRPWPCWDGSREEGPPGSCPPELSPSRRAESVRSPLPTHPRMLTSVGPARPQRTLTGL
jgi:hypothetical protein